MFRRGSVRAVRRGMGGIDFVWFGLVCVLVFWPGYGWVAGVGYDGVHGEYGLLGYCLLWGHMLEYGWGLVARYRRYGHAYLHR